MLAPIVVFAFNRPKELASMFDSLKSNPLYEQSPKFVYIDGPRNNNDIRLIDEVIKIAIKETDNVIISPINKGLGKSIIDGVSEILNRYVKAIIIEDDLKLMPGFLGYMNECLDLFESDKRIISVCGYSLKIKPLKDYSSDIYFGDRASSWGWGTWIDRWNKVDWNVKDWEEFSKDKKAIREFNKAGSDLFAMLSDYKNGKNHSWAIRFCYSQFRKRQWSVHPIKSFVDNKGFGESATNCRQKYNRFKIELCNGPLTISAKDRNTTVNNDILSQLHRYHSIPLRIYSRIRRILNI